ncbi:4Fe-4S dicluster domain-containing protein [Candidatus Poribacteria bacterium]|nr:4Fe-4S dicluster domain-containing protein [Candidatus Poribacteria bacterium]
MVSERVVLRFPRKLIEQPIIYMLSKKYDLVFNILFARVMPNQEGVLVAELSGEDDNYQQGIDYLKENEVDVQLLSRDVVRDEKRCTMCGACTAVCPTGALSIPDRKTMIVTFEVDKCVACGQCVEACPSNAMKVSLSGLEELGLENI